VGVRLIVEQPVHTMVTNVQGTETVLGYCSKFGKRVLVASSSEVYGDHREERPLSEDDRRVYGPTTEKRWLYADSKAMDEHLALAYHQARELDCVIARLFNTVGPRQSGQYGMVIPRFVERALAGAPLEVHGDGTQTRSFCHVSDTVRAIVGLMDARDISGEIFNIGSSERVRILDLAQRVLELTGSHVAEIFLERGNDVIVVDDLSTGARQNVPERASFEELDIAERDALEDVLGDGADLVCHLAAQASVTVSVEDPVRDCTSNVL